MTMSFALAAPEDCVEEDRGEEDRTGSGDMTLCALESKQVTQWKKELPGRHSQIPASCSFDSRTQQLNISSKALRGR